MILRSLSLARFAALAASVVFLAGVLTPLEAAAEKDDVERPYWSVEVKGGYFYPEIPDWATYYGDNKTWQASGSVAYKLLRQVEIGVEGGKVEDRGTAFAPLAGSTTGRVIYQLYPVNAFVLARGVFSERQWLVPYVGGGFTMIYYREKIEDQGYNRGKATGYHGRIGLQLLLDSADQKSANNFYMEYGIIHTYLFFEAQKTRVMVDTNSGESLDIGGLSYLTGLLFEF
jgi:hypothetical protein